MRPLYWERLKELFGTRLYERIPDEDLRRVDPAKYTMYGKSHENPNRRKIFVHMNSYYLPDSIRGMTDTVHHIWINSKEYFKRHVLRHEKIHVAHPDWPEDVVRQFHDSYEPELPGVDLVYV